MKWLDEKDTSLTAKASKLRDDEKENEEKEMTVQKRTYKNYRNQERNPV